MINFDNFKSSAFFVYAKGLTYAAVSDKLLEFIGLEETKIEKWSDNEKKFMNFLKKHFLDNSDE